LARRERKMVVAAIAVTAVALLYAAAIEPAWHARARLARELPQLQEQLAELEALRDEARVLRQQGFGTDTRGSFQANLERSLVRAGLAGKLRADSERSIAVSVGSVPAQAWFAWMEEFARESRVRIAHARIMRSGAPGTVEAEAGFELPGH
jgi:general secretion pathway protein M